MKFKFSLDRVMKHRKTLEDIAQRDFQLALADLKKEENQLEFLIQEKNKCYDIVFKKQSQGGNQGEALSQIDAFMKGQDIRIARQRKKIEECNSKVEEMREILLEKAKEYKIISELHDRKKAIFIKEFNKKESRKLDDQNIMRFRIKDDKNG
jgi:flagellar FliJ protein